MADAYHNGYETMVTAFCFALSCWQSYRFPNRFFLTQRKRPYLFLDLPQSNHSDLAAIISSNRNLFTLKLYRHFCPKFFSMKACNLCNLDFKTDFEISRATSGLTLEANCKFATFFSVANPSILCAPPQVVAERTRTDLAMSQTRSGVTTSKPNQADR